MGRGERVGGRRQSALPGPVAGTPPRTVAGPVAGTLDVTAPEVVAEVPEVVEAPAGPVAVPEPGPGPEPEHEPALEPGPVAGGDPTVQVGYDPEEMLGILTGGGREWRVPTLVRYRERGSVPVRFALVEVGEPFLREAWGYYRSTVADAHPEAFMEEVASLLSTSLPRTYRTVAELDLT